MSDRPLVLGKSGCEMSGILARASYFGLVDAMVMLLEVIFEDNSEGGNKKRERQATPREGSGGTGRLARPGPLRQVAQHPVDEIVASVRHQAETFHGHLAHREIPSKGKRTTGTMAELAFPRPASRGNRSSAHEQGQSKPRAQQEGATYLE